MNIYKRGQVYWCKFRIDNKLYQYSCKTKDKPVASEIAAAIYADTIRDRFNIPIKNKAVYNFKEVFTEYTKQRKEKIRERTASNHFLPILSNKEIINITPIDIKNYQFQRKLEIISLEKNIGKRESEINFRSVNYEIAILRNFFNYCIEKEIIDKNPASGIKKLNELSRLKTLSNEDIDKLIAGATNKLTKDLITFLIYTGCRKGEALNLKWDDVDLQNDVIAIKGTKTKFDRYIPISKPLKALLVSIQKNQDSLYIFERNGTKLTDFKHSFHTACRKAGLKDLRIHDLRHVFASKMVMNGTSLYITGELLGHRTTQMTKRYSHLVPDTLKKAVDDVWGKKK
ncbi:MAG: tyrosine-type recombinase/integrase [Deltaproteobacteria bacterium]|nr:tyrosine-type recombinase/integrase [Deltaproteobacteria bacterium]